MPVSQITLQTPKDVIKEGSQMVLVARFRDRDTAEGVIPTNVYYRIDCLTSGAEILDWTSIGPDTEGESDLPQSTITITATQNAIQRESDSKERRQITVATDYGLLTAWRESYEWDVVNLRGTP